jgi:aspartate dehydrogenase
MKPPLLAVLSLNRQRFERSVAGQSTLSRADRTTPEANCEEPEMTRRIALIGAGAIGTSLIERLARTPDAPQVTDVLLRPGRSLGSAGTQPKVHHSMDSLSSTAPDLLVECAGQGAVRDYVPAALVAGLDVVITSVGALADDELRLEISRKAQDFGGRARICSGAVGGLDILAAARLAGLDRFDYTARKPPRAFGGTAAENVVDLGHLQERHTLFEGTADEAARAYPKNANVAMTLALAVATPTLPTVRIVADPHVETNTHEISVSGYFGSFEMKLENAPSPDNPKTSFLTILSLERIIRSLDDGITI